eukprot:CAMPEP_0194048748 /NCGR_PEP_ID=MMETSP0009_2-20130614/28358_1 /TAXON_ID=210454 /ORGANISM="Grammatophora oceanica, Strain CCMP 410" /LENGTH=309 /DNA_ID=CAMNT_0038694705 /DNA_START=158 /DNA_END=1087 /DNA_ORIENTATION=+
MMMDVGAELDIVGAVMAPESQILEEIEDVLRVMKMQETTKYKCRDYFERTALAPSWDKKDVDEAWRQRMCEWMFGLVDHCNFRRDIVAISTAYLDLCLSKDDDIIHSRRSYQLAAMTAIYLAMKTYDTSYVKLESLVKLGRGLFQVRDVVEMERRMLAKLDWNIHPPTPMCFLRHYMRLFPTTLTASTTYMIAEVSRFVAEISVCLYKFVKYPPSVIAFAALLIAMDGIDEGSLPKWQRAQIYVRMSNLADLDHSSDEVLRVTKKLRASFEKNVDLKALMTTIDPTSQVGIKKGESTEDGSPKGVERYA